MKHRCWILLIPSFTATPHYELLPGGARGVFVDLYHYHTQFVLISLHRC